MGLASQARKQARKLGHDLLHAEHIELEGKPALLINCRVCCGSVVVRKNHEPQGTAVNFTCESMCDTDTDTTPCPTGIHHRDSVEAPCDGQN